MPAFPVSSIRFSPPLLLDWNALNPTPLVPLNSLSSPCSSSVGLPDSAASIAEWFGKGSGRNPRPQSAVAELGQINGVGINPFNSDHTRHGKTAEVVYRKIEMTLPPLFG